MNVLNTKRFKSLHSLCVLLICLSAVTYAESNTFTGRLDDLCASVIESPGDIEAENRLFEIWSMWDLVTPRDMIDALERISGASIGNFRLRSRVEEMLRLAMIRTGEVDAAKKAYASSGFIDRWLIVGPFDNEGKTGFERKLEPEEETGCEPDYRTAYEGKHRPVHWRALPEINPFGYVHLESALHPNINVCAYALTFVRSAEKRQVQIWAAGGGALKLWFNGRGVFEDDEYREGSPDRLGARVTLEKGYNRILVKSCTTTEAWGFFARLVDEDGHKPDVVFSIKPDTTAAADVCVQETGGIKRIDSTLDLLEKRLEAEPDSADAMAALARYLFETGADDAVKHRAHDLAYRAAEKSATVKNCILWADVASDTNEEKRALERALGRDPHNLRAMMRMAELEAAGFEPRKGMQYAGRILRKSPGYFPARLLLYRVEARMGFKVSAWKKAHSAAAGMPDVALVTDTLRSLANGAGIYAEADGLNRKFLKFWYSDIDLHMHFLKLAQHRRDRVALERHAGAMLDLSPFELNVYMDISRAFEGAGMRDESEEILEKACRTAPQEAELWAALGLVQLRKGEGENGIRSLMHALSLKPQDAVLREYIEHLKPEDASTADEFLVDPGEFSAMRRSGEGDEHARILADIEVVEVHDNGLGSRHRQIAVEILSEEGARDWRQHQVLYVPDSQRVRIERARVYHEDGTTAELAGTYSYSISEPWYQMYYDVYALVMDMPPLESGDIVEIVYRLDDIAARNMFNDYFGDFVQVQGALKKDLFRYVLITPAQRKFFFNTRGIKNLDRRTIDRDSEVLHVFEAAGVGRIVMEQGMPGYGETGSYIHVSTYSSWDELGEWYRGLVRDQLRADEKIRSIVERITQGLKSEMDIIRAIHEWVLRNTRYVALEFGIHGYKQYPASVVAARGFGDCKDKAGLMVVMLRLAGIEAEMVLVRTRDLGMVETEPASLAVFNHAIVHIPGQDLWLDGTAEHNGTGELPFGDQGALALTIGGDEYNLTTIPVKAARNNSHRQSLEVSLKKDGSARLASSWDISGSGAALWRMKYESKATRKHRFAGDLGEHFPGVKIIELDFVQLDDIEESVQVSCEAEVPRFARVEDEVLLFKPAPGLNLTASHARLSTREHDLMPGMPWHSDLSVEIRLPKGFVVRELPEPAVIRSKFGEMKLEIRAGGSRIFARRTFTLSVDRIAADEYEAFRDFCIEVDGILARTIAVAREN